jgi:Predicted glycosyltransferases
MPDLTIVTTVYGQPDLLTRFLAYTLYDTKAVELVVVDDCGDPPVEKRPSIDKLFRVDDDIPWNQPGARNLGMVHATAPVILFVDVDMIPQSADQAEWLATARTLKSFEVVIPPVRYTTGELNFAHPHNYLIRREDMIRIGGYDEDYCGHYGWDDVQQLHLFEMLFDIKRPRGLCVDYIDGATETLDRNQKRNHQLHVRKMREIEGIGAQRWCSERKGSNLRFRWHQVH